MSDPTCRGLRELLGVYVVGAIEPADRSAVEAHLSHCDECREELARLAVLPALLHRVSVTDAVRLLSADAPGDDSAEPSQDLLPALLRQVAARRRSLRLRAAFAVAAVMLAVAGGASAVTVALSSHGAQRAPQDQAGTRTGTVDVMVRYGTWQWGPGTAMAVHVRGLATWSRCKFWVITKAGHKELAAEWTVRPGSSRIWYSGEADVSMGNITQFVLTTAAGKVIKFPAD